MLDILKELFTSSELLEGEVGVEREGLRTNTKGELSLTKHPEVFENKLTHPYITTDFSESQLEFITPNLSSSKEVYDFLNTLYDIASLNIGDENIWPYSMPCDIPAEKDIPISEYKDCEACKAARLYREQLFEKYGGKKQLISGIHYNFSFKEELIERLYSNHIETKQNQHSAEGYKEFKNNIYLKMTRNYLRYRWILIYLLGATPGFHKSYATDCTGDMDRVGLDSITNKGAISYRNGDWGYKNKIELQPDYTSVESYIESINDFVRRGSINSYKELYSQIRPKAKDNTDLLNSLRDDGILYIEIRSIDNNPFEKSGISIKDLDFLHLFMLHLMIKSEDDMNGSGWQREADSNQTLVAMNGLDKISLSRNGQKIDKVEWGLEILEEIKEMNNYLELGRQDIIEQMIQKIKNPNLTYGAEITKLVEDKGYISSGNFLGSHYKKTAYQNRYKLYGHEDMELSTQILMKEAIKRGMKVEILDRAENFIALKQDDHIEYVKQATKTSKDSYVTMLIMENKTVTKKVLDKAGIYVPKGIEVERGMDLEKVATRYSGQAIVVKPKSTNFGKGISIFTKGAQKDDIIKALEIGFTHDNTVLIEEFIKGKEYRFLVIGDKVEGVLHRVPANVEGDGENSISQLVEIKNRDSLRGVGYHTPLEKIMLDDSSRLFLKQSNLDFEYIPKNGETIYLRENSNISTGGDSIDYTDDIPQKFKDIAVQSAKAAGAKFCGVDMMLENYKDENSKYAIIEINFNPAIHIHSYPFKGEERLIAEKILDVLGFKSLRC